MISERAVLPVLRPVVGTIRPPGSKSLTNRALVIAAMSQGASELRGVLESRDTEVMIQSLRRLGISIHQDFERHEITVIGCGGSTIVDHADLWLENSGTSIRFLTACCATLPGMFRLDGNARMRERPIGDLLEAIRQLGGGVRTESPTGCPPVLIESKGMTGGVATLNTEKSSQFLSALLMAAPNAQQAVEICLEGGLVSEPYIDMTLGVMARFGVTVDHGTPGVYRVEPQKYRAIDYSIEPDASAASYFFALAAVTGGKVTVQGLSAYALQGDVRFVDALEQMGCQVQWEADAVTVTGGALRGIEIDMNGISDTAQTLAAVAPFAEGPTRIYNVAHMRHKETDRVAAVVTELRRLGLKVDEHDDGMTINPGPMQPATIHTYDDHRMAMSFAILGLRNPGTVISDPGCTAKTYPHFFDDLDRLCGPFR